jgi:hypothetical protein
MIPGNDFDGLSQGLAAGVFHGQFDAQKVLFVQKRIGLAHIDHHADFQRIGGPGRFNPDVGGNSRHRPGNGGRFDKIAAGDGFLFRTNFLLIFTFTAPVSMVSS